MESLFSLWERKVGGPLGRCGFSFSLICIYASMYSDLTNDKNVFGRLLSFYYLSPFSMIWLMIISLLGMLYIYVGYGTLSHFFYMLESLR